MKKYTITEQQLKEIHDRTSVYNQEQIEEWFPEVFKVKVEVGKWYKDQEDELFFPTNLNNDTYASGYGWINGEFTVRDCIRNNIWMNIKLNRKATDSEVLENFKKEALKRYKVGQRVQGAFTEYERILYSLDSFVFVENSLWSKSDLGNVCLFKDGEWAKVIKPKIFTKEQAKTYLEEFFADGTEIQITD